MSREPAGWTARRLRGETAHQPPWTIAVFAHNEGRRIGAALESIPAAAGGRPVRVVVLANGCSDDTIDRAGDAAGGIADLTVVDIGLADKANAWNLFIHDLWTDQDVARTDVFFFMDGDVRLEADALPLLASVYETSPTVNAVGAMPTTGRDREAWRERMVRNRSLAGNLYSLRGSFVSAVRARQIRMPIGLFGEDSFVSWLAEHDLGDSLARDPSPRCLFQPSAGFAFDSLSPWRPRDYRIYLRRKWRYARRSVQHEMLMPMIDRHGLTILPAHIEDVYRMGPLPSRMKWIGRGTGFRMLAVQWARRFRRV